MPGRRLSSASGDTATFATDIDLDDARLVAAAQEDPRHFTWLFRRYWQPVLRYCALRLACHADAEDAASEIFVDAYAHLDQFQDSGRAGAFRRWLFTIAHHEIVTRYREQARRPAEPLPDDGIDVGDPADALEQTVATADEVARMIALVRVLPDRPREVVALRLAGLTDREIAAVLGISPAAVRQAQSRAVAQLRSRMGVVANTKQATDD